MVSSDAEGLALLFLATSMLVLVFTFLIIKSIESAPFFPSPSYTALAAAFEASNDLTTR
jgi:hypothetical protein